MHLQAHKLHLILWPVQLREPFVVNGPPVHLYHLTCGSDQNNLLNTCTGPIAVKLIVPVSFFCAWRENFHNKQGEAKTIFCFPITFLTSDRDIWEQIPRLRELPFHI